MSIRLPIALAVSAVVTSGLGAEVVLRPHDPAAALHPASEAARLRSLVPKLDEPSDALLLPFFEVDTTSLSGTTTLFAVRNRTEQTRMVTVAYTDQRLAVQRQDVHAVQPRAALTVNVRDVPGLAVDPDSFARGLAIVVTTGAETLVGDFFQVDPGGDFATGERLITLADLCLQAEIRNVDFGSGTELHILLDAPQGADPEVDPPSFSVTALSEAGVLGGTTDVFSDLAIVHLTAADFTAAPFGTLLFDFSSSSGGWVYAEYSAFGRFSAGLNSACTEPPPP